MRGARPARAIEQAVAECGALHRGDRVVVACSGGSDSVALAAILAAVAAPMKLQIVLAHVNHGVRPSAWQDEAVVLRVSAALGLPVRIVALQSAERDEASLRELRYAALTRLAQHEKATAVASGHTAEDQTETVLLALFRGAGARGLAGIPQRRRLAKGIDLVRPLLAIEREDVRSYVQRRGLPFCVDPTNADLLLRRNAVREALAALRPLFQGLDAAVARAAHVISAELAGAPRAAVRRRVRDQLQRHDALNDVDFKHVEAAVRAIERGRSGHFQMSRHFSVTVENGELTVHRKRR